MSVNNLASSLEPVNECTYFIEKFMLDQYYFFFNLNLPLRRTIHRDAVSKSQKSLDKHFCSARIMAS